MSKSVYTPKVLELISKEVGESFKGHEIVQMLTKFGLARELIQYPNTKWWTVNEAFKYIKGNYEKADDSISRLIMEFLLPLNHNLDKEKAENLANKVEKYLKYDNFHLQYTGKEYIVFSDEEMEEMYTPSEEFLKHVEEDEKNKLVYQKRIKENSEAIKKLKDNHQAYVDILEIFCQNPKKPTKELNDAYLFLSKKIEETIKEFNLSYFGASLYKPFSRDLYTAEIEWKGKKTEYGSGLSWDSIRPFLYGTHSAIIKIQNISEEGVQMTDEEKQIEEIRNLISEKRTPKTSPEKENITKMEILHKYEKTNEEKFYITKKDDDFHYKGRYLNLSKKSDYYKVFSSLYAKLPEGGEITYKELGGETKSRIKKTSGYKDEEMQKFIQRNLTDKSNGFMRYAGIPTTEDNGRSLIEVVRGSGIIFNNKAG